MNRHTLTQRSAGTVFRHLYVGILTATLITVLTGCYGGGGMSTPEGPTPLVEAVQAHYGKLPLTQRLSGRVHAHNQIAVYPEVSAPIVAVLVRNGDRVKQGDVLVKLRDKEFRERYNQAVAGHGIAAADPLDRTAIDAIGLALGRPVEIFVGLPTDIDAAMARLFGTGPAGNAAKAEVTSQATGHDAAADIQHLQEQDTDAAAVRLLNQIIAGAVANKASDIHIEPFDQTLHIRYRVDGQLRHAAAPDKNLHRTLIGRIKILAGMDITEQRKPQDGRCRITAEGRQIDLRVSLLPSLYGESAVLRILDQDRAALDLDDLGFERALQDQIGALIRQPHGIMLICGPTGSGKTTSLYAILRQLKAEQRKIVTVEDPVEYQLEGISQIQTRPNIGLGFAEVLRSVLRHDPDVIMVGEARDAETARTAVQAALTGHLVLCSVHTNDAAGAIARLIDMGVEPYLLASTLRGVLAQRLVRRLCPACREADPHAGTLAADYADTPEIPRDGAYYRPVGCEACGQTGFTGRIAIAEYLPATATIRQCIIDRRPSSDIHDTARQAGMRSLRIDGLVKAAGGITAIQEVLGVTVE